MAGTLRLAFDPSQVMLVGLGGEGRQKNEYKDGVATGAPLLRDGAAVYRLTGLAVSLNGQGLDGPTVETATPLEEVGQGVVYGAEGGPVIVEVRADARAGFNGGPPRGELAAKVWVERLVPVGRLDSLLASGAATGDAKRSGDK